jgi:hypothetical protein
MRQTIKTWIVSALLLIISNLFLQLKTGFIAMDKWFYAGQLDSWQRFFIREIPWGEVIGSLAILVAYTVLIAVIGISYFKRRDIG